MITGWQAEALNTAPDSANEIHGDRMAKLYGFRGGLVPGVTISAYLLQPAVAGWGMDFLNQGFAHVRVTAPLYDGERFEVIIDDQQEAAYTGRLLGPDGSQSANAEVRLAPFAPAAPARRGDPVAGQDHQAPAASIETWRHLMSTGCVAGRYRWGDRDNLPVYLRDESLMPDLLTGSDAFANMAFILGTTNWVLAANAYMNPWIHLETWSQNYAAIGMDTPVVTEMRVLDLFEKKGHEFVDVDMALFNEKNDTCLSTVRLRAIYRLRGSQ